MTQNEIDINVAFDNILLSEEQLIENSFEQGYKEGEKQGNPEGYHLGYHRGAEVGAELGYYLSVTENLISKATSESEKVNKLLTLVKDLILSFPVENTEDDILGQLDTIRTKHKKACSLMKIDSNWPEADKLSF